MAQKRMFDKAIIDTDRFMDLGLPSKALYFLLGMEADDEGFVSYKKVMRIHGGNDDDLKLLIAKGFVLHFPSGVVVITDWNKNNYLDSNRVKPTEYLKEKAQLLLTEAGKYEFNGCSTSIEESRGEESRVSGAKVRADEIKLVEDPERMTTARYKELLRASKPPSFDPKPCFRLFADPFPNNWLNNRTQRAAAKNLTEERGLEKVVLAFGFWKQHKDEEYCPDCSTPWDMDSKWTKLQIFRDKRV